MAPDVSARGDPLRSAASDPPLVRCGTHATE